MYMPKYTRMIDGRFVTVIIRGALEYEVNIDGKTATFHFNRPDTLFEVVELSMAMTNGQQEMKLEAPEDH